MQCTTGLWIGEFHTIHGRLLGLGWASVAVVVTHSPHRAGFSREKRT